MPVIKFGKCLPKFMIENSTELGATPDWYAHEEN